MSERKGSVADGMFTVWFLVLSVWMFTEGYTVFWLAGVAAALVGSFTVRAVLQRKEREK